MTWTGLHRHANGTDDLYAYPKESAAFDGGNAIAGVNANQATQYEFAGLDDATSYEVRLQNGETPVLGDAVLAEISKGGHVVSVANMAITENAFADDAISADAVSPDAVNKIQAEVLGAIAGVSGGVAGSGAVPHPVSVTSNGQPVDGAEVWITTDTEGTNVVAGTLTSNAFGNTPNAMLDPGTYYVWVQKAGINFANPTKIEVVAP